MAKLLQALLVDENSESLGEIKSLYEKSFPANERGNLMNLIEEKTGHAKLIAFFDENVFCGFAGVLVCSNVVHIIYFAIEESLRSKGYGASVLYTMEKMYPGCRIIADIEVLDKAADNNKQRIRRLNFYLKNGFKPTDITYDWENESYRILSYGGNITAEEFKGFWQEVYSSNALLRDF